MDIKLRDYQQRQMNFLVKNSRHKFVTGIESPTGSGKSIVMLEYIKYLFATHSEDMTIILTTGFNNLVYDMADKAKDLGLDPIIFVGKQHMACGLKEQPIDPSGRVQAFTNDESLRCEHPSNISPLKEWKDKSGKKHIGGCNNSLLMNARADINRPGHKLIITNHSCYLIYLLQYPLFNPDVVIVDEAHTFQSFYDSFLMTSINSRELKNINSVLDKRPQGILFKNFIEKGNPLPPQLCDRICELLSEYEIDIKKPGIYKDLSRRIKEFSNSTKRVDNYFDIDKYHMDKIRFWYDFQVNQNNIKYILFSATLDRFTRLMFGLKPEYFYKEKNLNIINYKKSDCFVIKERDFSDGLNKFMDICREKKYVRGMILSTTNKDVNYIKEHGIEGYNVYTTIDSYKNGEEPKVLVGSRALFQGIDLPDIQFVGLNRIPFARYDDIFRARIKYLQDIAKIDPWNDYSIPEVINTLIQTTGRLWRKPGDNGTIGIFDPRLDGRFKYMLDYGIKNVRYGININIIKGKDEDSSNLDDLGDLIKEDYYGD